jgi:CO dehydrogenase maturation factor
LGRIRDLAYELKLDVERVSAIIARVPAGKLDEHIEAELELLNIKPIACIPVDETIQKFDLEKRSILEIPETSPAVKAVKILMDGILSQNITGGDR